MDDNIMQALGLLSDPRSRAMGGLLGPMQPITSAQLPKFNPPHNLDTRSWQQKLMMGLQGAPDKLAQGLMPTPEGIGGLLGDDAIKSARHQGLLDFGLSMLGSANGQNGGNAPGFGAALAQGVQAGRKGYDGAVGEKVQGALVGNQLKQMQQRQQVLAKMQQAYPNFATMQPADQHRAITGMFGEMIANGMFDEAGKIASVLPSMQPAQPKPPAPPLQIDLGGTKELRYPDGRVERLNKTPSPRDPNAPDHASELSTQRMFQREQQLADDFNSDTKEVRAMAQRVAGSLEEVPAAKHGDGVAQVNLLYAFVSSMDPGSAVREGEIGLVRSAGSLVQQAQGFLSKYTQGKAVVVPPDLIDQMAGLMRRRLEGSRKYVENRSKYYQDRGKQWGVSPSAFPALDVPKGGAASTAPATGSNPLLR